MAFRYVTPAEPNRDPADISSFPLRQASPPWHRHAICYAVLRFPSGNLHTHQRRNSVPRPPIDLTSHLNQDVTRGNPADFPVMLRSIYQSNQDTYAAIPKRQAVVREDTGQVLAIVSDRYTLVPHQRILEL